MRSIFFFLAVAVLVWACKNERKQTVFYYPIDSLIEAQVFYLSESHASLSKKATIDGEHDEIVTPKDTTGWRHELNVFAQLNDINKPSNYRKYRVETGKRDANSNLLVYSMESNDSLPVDYLKIYYLSDLNNIRKIEARYHEENSLLGKARLLSSSRLLTMNFENINNKIVLTSYSITGGQKTLLGDTVQFSVNGMITLP